MRVISSQRAVISSQLAVIIPIQMGYNLLMRINPIHWPVFHVIGWITLLALTPVVILRRFGPLKSYITSKQDYESV